MVNIKLNNRLSLSLLTICVLIGNIITLSIDNFHSPRNSDDESFKRALNSIHHRRNMAEKRRSPYHFENSFSKKNFHLDDEVENNYYHPSGSGFYSPAMSRNIQRFLSEIGDYSNEDRKQDGRRYEKRYGMVDRNELKSDVVNFDGKRKKAYKRQHFADMEGPSRIFTHKPSPISTNVEVKTEPQTNNESQQPEEKYIAEYSDKRKKKGKTFNYAGSIEHFNRFWDPEKSRARFQKKSVYRNNNREPSLFTKRRRFEKRRSYQEPIHNSMKRSKSNNEKVIGELKEILKDENEGKESVKKQDNDRETKNKVEETKSNNTNDVKDSSGNQNANTADESNDKNDGDKFNEWLRDEYFKTMAMTMATMKKKRSGFSPVISPVPQDTSSRRFLINSEDLEDEKAQKFQAIEEKLKAIESAMLSDALQLIHEGTDGRQNTERFGQEVLDKLYAANDVQKMREALDHLRGTMNKMKRYDEDDDDDDEENSSESDEVIRNWPNVLPKKREEENLAKALGVMAPYQSKRQYSIPSDIQVDASYIPSISMRSFPPYASEEASSNQLMPVYSPTGNSFNRELESDEVVDIDALDTDNCPALDLLSSDCSILGDIVPGGPLKRLVLEACNWHEVCYTCGGSFGLSADECDVGFVQQSQTICQDDVPCQTTARMMLLPLRQRRVFFKRSVPAVCYREPCVEQFLRHG